MRGIIGFGYEENGWYWNTSYHIGRFAVRDGANEERAFLRAVHKLGVYLVPRKTTVTLVDDIYEIQNRETGQPLFAAIPVD